MTKTIEFFFDYISPYSYIALPLARNLAADTGTSLEYRPFFLGGVMKESGNRPPGAVPAKGQYLMLDLARSARHAGLPFNLNPHFPMMDTRHLLAATIKMQGSDEQTKFIHTCFDAVWANPEGLNVSDWEQISPVLETSGFSLAKVHDAASDQASRDLVKSNTTEAIQRGAFGAPSFFIGDELFFGHDRMEHMRAVLV